VPLLARRPSVGLQDAVDELRQLAHLGPQSTFAQTLLRNGTPERLAHQSTVHAELACDTRDAANAELVFPSKLLE
jgi:hypothetical protein